eukprot:gene5737-9560_t
MSKFPDPNKLAKDFAKLRVGGKKKDDSKKSGVSNEAPLRHYNSLAVKKINENKKKDEVSFDDIQTVKEVVKDPTYKAEKIIGTGSFGTVYLAKVNETGETVAIKKVLQDKRFKNRELQIMKTIKHRNIVHMENYFYSNGQKKDEIYLNLVLEYLPHTAYSYTSTFTKKNEFMPLLEVKLYIYQMCRALAYLHETNICHRDIKPHNLLIDGEKGVLKFIDFGSAKQLVEGEPNVSYICSRYYRAPELIFGATHYTTAIDIWSTGCVMGEMLTGLPLFAGGTSIDQLVEIIRIRGTPTYDEVLSMNQEYVEFKFPSVTPQSWEEVFAGREKDDLTEACDLITKFLQYNPKHRISCYEALAHPFFDDLRKTDVKLSNGNNAPPLFDFSEQEVKKLEKLKILDKILPVKKN